MKNLKLYIVVCLIIITKTTFSQQFSQNFTDKTLRIDYYHIGDFKVDSIKIAKTQFFENWAGSQINLIDTFNYGSYYITMYDSVSNILIYSHGYSTLFEEWRTTPEAKISKKTFEETCLLPMPKKSVKIEIKHRKKDGKYYAFNYFYLNPKTVNKSKNKKLAIENLHIGGKTNSCYDIVIVPDGYSIKDSLKLKQDFARFCDYIVKCNPYSDIKNKINIRGVWAFSKESGITDPNISVFRNTIIGSSFNTIGSDRYLMTLNVWQLQNITESAPFDGILIMSNTKKYGGGGIYNYYATVSSDDANSNYVCVHELGHSISGLADEYYTSEVAVEDFYNLNVEPWEPNITTLVDFDKKWKSMLPNNIIIPTPNNGIDELGVYEGAGYMSKGIFRPALYCTMKEIRYNNFCPVCTRSIIQMIDFYSK